MQTLQSYFQTNTDKFLLTSIPGGLLSCFPLNGNVFVYSENYDAYYLSKHPEYLQYYSKAFGLPQYTFVEDSYFKKHTSQYVLFDKIPYKEKKFMHALQTTGVNVSEASLNLNTKYDFQMLVSETLGKEFSTSPIRISKGMYKENIIHTVSALLDKENKLVVKISDTTFARSGADRISIISSAEAFVLFLEDTFSHAENGNFVLLDSKGYLQNDLILERYIDHSFSPSVTFYLHEDNVELLSTNYQFLKDGAYVGSTNVLPKQYNKYKTIIEESAMILARKAQAIGARGFIGFDLIVDTKRKHNNLIFIEANYRTTGSTTPHLITQKAVRFTKNMEWLYLGSFEYNDTIPNLNELLHRLKEKGILFEGFTEFQIDQKPLQCTITFGERDKRCGLCFFWEEGTYSISDILKKTNTFLQEINSPDTFVEKDFYEN